MLYLQDKLLHMHFFEKELSLLNKEQLLQLFNYETMCKIDLLDTSLSGKSYLKSLLGNLEIKLSENTNKTPATITIETNNLVNQFEYGKNEINISLLPLYSRILYLEFLTHESTHAEEIFCLKNCNFKNKKEKQVSDIRKNDFNANYPLIKLQTNKTMKLLFGEDTLKQFLVSNRIDDYIKSHLSLLDDQIKQSKMINDVAGTFKLETQKQYFSQFEYLSAFELEARIEELKQVSTEYEIIDKEPNLNVKLKQLKCLKDDTELWLSDAKLKQKLVEEYIHFVI